MSGGYTGPGASHWDHYGHGTGEGVSWPAGDRTHQSLDFFLRAAAASASCGVEGGSVYPQFPAPVAAVVRIIHIFQRNYSPALTRVYFIFSAPAD